MKQETESDGTEEDDFDVDSCDSFSTLGDELNPTERYAMPTSKTDWLRHFVVAM